MISLSNRAAHSIGCVTAGTGEAIEHDSVGPIGCLAPDSGVNSYDSLSYPHDVITLSVGPTCMLSRIWRRNADCCAL